MELSEQDFLEICKTKIEEKYHLGNGDRRLKQRDFEYLIDLIEETSGTKLSISTLKRLWRETADQNPHPSTLDALVSILGYKDWLEFKVENVPKIQTVDSSKSTKSAPSFIEQWGRRKPVLIGMVSLVILALIIISFTSRSIVTPADAEEVMFNVSNTVETGVPTTVIFNYDLNDIDAKRFYIQQDWDPNNRQEIDPSLNYFTSVYYYPGFHKARIYADETVLKTEEVFIRTERWLAAAVHRDDEEHPVYLSAEPQDGTLSIPGDILPESGLDMARFGGSGFFNIGDFGDLSGHNFIAETKFKNRSVVNTPCPFAQFTIHTEANIYFLQFSSVGCVGELELMIGEKFISGNENDLSAFGADLRQWQEVSLSVENKFATIFLNDEQIYEIGFNNDFGKIVGVDYRFSGLGDLDYLRFQNLDGSLVFEDDF